jgi:hypothetical protein
MTDPVPPVDPHPLDAMAALEWRYDGPVPEALRRAARAGGAARLAAAEAMSRSALFNRLAQHARAALAQRRRTGAAPDAAAARDLDGHRRAGLAWRERATILAGPERPG